MGHNVKVKEQDRRVTLWTMPLERLLKQIRPTERKENGMLRFSDGQDFDCSGELRAERRNDGWYVVGGGIMFAVDSEAEALREVEAITKERAREKKGKEAKGCDNIKSRK